MRATCLACDGKGWGRGYECERCAGAGVVELGPTVPKPRRVPRYATERAEGAIARVLARLHCPRGTVQLARMLADGLARELPSDPVTAIAERARINRDGARQVVEAYIAALREHARAMRLADPYLADDRGTKTRLAATALDREADLVAVLIATNKMIVDLPEAAE